MRKMRNAFFLGPGTDAVPLDAANIDTKIINVGPKVINDFDDVRVFGGG